jgi:AcrR family transcriptional regulator
MLVVAMLANANPNPKGEGPPALRQRLSSAERRAAIITAAVELFSKNGFRGTTTRELAAAVGVSEPVLYQHFETKRELYTAIVDSMVSEVSSSELPRLQAVASCNDDHAFFGALGRVLLEWYFDDTHHIRLLLFSSLESHELADLWHERATVKFLSFIEEYIARRARDGAFAVANPALSARAYMGMVGHYGMTSVIFKCPFPEMSREQVIENFVDTFLNGIRNV